MNFACSGVCNGTCDSCRSFADAAINPSLSVPLGDFVKKVSSASLKKALEKVSGNYQGEGAAVQSAGKRVLRMSDGREISIAPDAGGVPSPAKARDPAIDSELKTLGKYKGGK